MRRHNYIRSSTKVESDCWRRAWLPTHHRLVVLSVTGTRSASDVGFRRSAFLAVHSLYRVSDELLDQFCPTEPQWIAGARASPMVLVDR